MEQLECLLNRDSNMSIVSQGTGRGRQVLASRSLAAGQIIGPPRGIGVDLVLDPVVVLRDHRVGKAIVDSMGTGDGGDRPLVAAERKRVEEMAFWMSIAAMARDAEARRRQRRDSEHPQKKRKTQEERERVVDSYLLSLPREGPDPCCWCETERKQLLSGTPLSKQINNTLQQVKQTYNRVTEGFDEGELEDIPAFSILGRGNFPSVLWARSMYLSRSFTRSLADEEGIWWQGRKKYTPPLESPPSLPGKSSVPARGEEEREGAEACDVDTILSIRLGGHSAPLITVQKQPQPQLESKHRPGSTLGIMIPLYDMLDHKSGHAVQWEAATCQRDNKRCIRFRCVEGIGEGQPVWTNYGPKGNGELLAAYGFATRDNVFDSVDGIVLGLRAPPASRMSPSENDTDVGAGKSAPDRCGMEVQVLKAQMEFIRERSLPHRFEEKEGQRVLLLGPFSLHRRLTAHSEGNMNHHTDESDDSSGGVIPHELYHALSVIGMDDVEEGPIVSVEELETLKKVLTEKLAGFGDGGNRGEEMIPIGQLRCQFVEAYKDGQREILRLALAELDSLMPT